MQTFVNQYGPIGQAIATTLQVLSLDIVGEITRYLICEIPGTPNATLGLLFSFDISCSYIVSMAYVGNNTLWIKTNTGASYIKTYTTDGVEFFLTTSKKNNQTIRSDKFLNSLQIVPFDKQHTLVFKNDRTLYKCHNSTGLIHSRIKLSETTNMLQVDDNGFLYIYNGRYHNTTCDEHLSIHNAKGQEIRSVFQGRIDSFDVASNAPYMMALLVSRDSRRTVNMLSTETGQVLRQLLSPLPRFPNVTFHYSKSTQQFYACSTDGNVKVFSVTGDFVTEFTDARIFAPDDMCTDETRRIFIARGSKVFVYGYRRRQ